ncbi:uncharacterized protein LOC108046160 [Drosophila rhopaloa]|uniref:Uncharacterized protein LOC108046160 n=1 Tax=Drosophila rhopaloa TaxID=1041015 RepID=A0A6P4ESS6_DRORH|nr:uncharacterized protein LOC108046160 [Drosophila rhopaloa]
MQSTMENREDQAITMLNSMSSVQEKEVRSASEALAEEFGDGDGDGTRTSCALLMSSKNAVSVRLNAAKVLESQITDGKYWESLTADQSSEILALLFDALKSLVDDDVEQLRGPTVRIVGLAMSQEPGEWSSAILAFVEANCLSVDAKDRQLGATIFSQLAKETPEVFLHQMDRAQRIFLDGLQLADNEGCLVTPITEGLVVGWTRALAVGHKNMQVSGELIERMPLIMRLFRLWPYESEEQYCYRGYQLVKSLLDHLPATMGRQLRLLVPEVVSLVADHNLAMPMRIMAMVILRRLLLERFRKIIELEMMDGVLMVLYRLIGVTLEPEGEALEDYLNACRAQNSIVGPAVDTVRSLSSRLVADDFVPLCLDLVSSHLETKPPASERLGILIFLGVVAEGTVDQLDEMPLGRLLALIECGLDDPAEMMVRRAAQFAMCLMVENLQPEITQLADRLMPLYVSCFDRMAVDSPRLFHSMEILVESLRDDVVAIHVPELMGSFLRLLEKGCSSVFARQMALSGIAVVGKVAPGEALHPYCDRVVDAVQPCLYFPGDDALQLKSQALRVLGMIGRVNKEKFFPLALDLLEMILSILQERNAIPRFTFDLLGQLCATVPDAFKAPFDLIINSVFCELYKSQQVNIETDGESQSESENQNEDEVGLLFEYMSTQECDHVTDEREEAVSCLKSLVVHLPDQFDRYFMEATDLLLQCTQDSRRLRPEGFSTLIEIILHQWRRNKVDEAQSLCSKVLARLFRSMLQTYHLDHVIGALNCCKTLLQNLGMATFKIPKHADKLFAIMRKALRRKLKCQIQQELNCYEDLGPEDWSDSRLWSKLVHQEFILLQTVSELLPVFGDIVGPQKFVACVKTINLRSLWRPRKDLARKYFLCGVIIRCLESLGHEGHPYYEMLCRCTAQGLLASKRKWRKRSFESLVEVVKLIDRKPEIIITTLAIPLANALREPESWTRTQREQGCVLASKMMLQDHTICPVSDFLDSFLELLPFRDIPDVDLEHGLVAQAMLLVYEANGEAIQSKVPMILKAFMEILEGDSLMDKGSRYALDLIEAIKKDQMKELESLNSFQ